MATFSPLATVTVMTSTTASRASAAARLLPRRDSSASTSCPLFTAFLPLGDVRQALPGWCRLPSSGARLEDDGRTTRAPRPTPECLPMLVSQPFGGGQDSLSGCSGGWLEGDAAHWPTTTPQREV